MSPGFCGNLVVARVQSLRPDRQPQIDCKRTKIQTRSLSFNRVSEYAIETEGLTKVFRSRFSSRELRAVDDISLRVPVGSTYGLLGPNGAGKTTFVKMLLSCTHQTTGRAMVFGRDTREP